MAEAESMADRDDAATLKSKASKGMAWLMAQTLGYKVISLFGTIYLTFLIAPEHLGQMTLALGVASFTNFLQQPGLREVLVQRRTRTARWDGPALSLAATMGFVAMVMTALAAPLAGLAWESPAVVNLLLILSMAAPFFGLAVVPEARLQSQLRFGALAAVEFLRGTGLLLSQIGLAYWAKTSGHTDWGAYALAAPVPAFAAMRCVGLWLAAAQPVRLSVRPSRWRFLWTDSAKLFVSSMVGMVISQGSLFVLGWRYDAQVVGLYAFAFNLSLITAVMITQNIGMVIFPVLSTMQRDPQRLKSTFLRSGRLLNMLAIPACLLQGALAEPFVRTVCDPRWAGSAPIMEILSVAMALIVIWPSSRALMQAQGRYTLALVMQLTHSTLFIIAVIIAAQVGQGVSVAVAVTIVYALIGLLDPAMALRPIGGTLRDVVSLVAAPMVVGLLGVVGVCAGVRWLLPADHEYLPAVQRWLSSDHHRVTTAYFPQAVAMIAGSLTVCTLLYSALMPHEFAELLHLVRRILGRFSRVKAG
jgi:PST family polysaccharide transporter